MFKGTSNITSLQLHAFLLFWYLVLRHSVFPLVFIIILLYVEYPQHNFACLVQSKENETNHSSNPQLSCLQIQSHSEVHSLYRVWKDEKINND